MKAHPAADLFPMLPEYALAELARDIEANGLHDPICVWNGQIVDGRNRMAAVVKTMRAPCYREMEFKDEAECVRFIISTNIHRRHLTESQRAMIANELAKLGEGRPGKETAQIKAVSQAQAADMMQVSRSSVQAARRVSEAAPDLAAKVKAGEIKVSKAAAMARERTATPTDPDRADDRVVDATAEAHADGYTKKMEAVWSAYWKLDETEKTAFHERQREKGMAK